MNVYAEAVKKGGDHWACYVPEKLSLANARSKVTQADMDDLRMFMAEKYPETRRALQTITYGPL